jgi:Fe-S cluster biogenesis protein NfuA
MSQSAVADHPLYARVEQALDRVRPYLRKDGGDIELVAITEDLDILVRLLGACESCPMSFMTMKAGVEAELRGIVPEIRSIQTVDSSSAAPNA